MATARLIFPHQLFENITHYSTATPIVLLEEWLYFKQYAFHQQKLVLHRASMQYYQHWLLEKGFTVWYMEATHTNCDVRNCLQWLHTEKGITHIEYTEVVDDWLQRRIHKACSKYGITYQVQNTPNFLNTAEEGMAFFKGKKTFFQTDFYVHQRKLRSLLLEDGKPLGGKWTFDAENREKYPSHAKPPKLGLPQNDWVKNARTYVQENFSSHYGQCKTLWNQSG
ncbi:MAG: cryptochrome/photolyase family protein, partial [Bacteroidetes bacterium]